MTIVLCSKGYRAITKNILIKGISKIKTTKNNMIFHAGTKFNDGKLLSSGGRVLNFTCIGNSFLTIRKKTIQLIKKLDWKNGLEKISVGKLLRNENN